MGNWGKQARSALSSRNYTQAGDFFKLDGNYRAAIKAYVKGKNYSAAAKMYEDIGKVKKAQKLLEKDGSPKDLAQFHIRNGNPEMAIGIYINNNLEFDAAELLEKSNELERAAMLYEKLNILEKAGILFGKVNNFDRAIAAFSRIIESYKNQTGHGIRQKTLKYQGWIANLHIGAKRFNQAGEIFLELNQTEKAAKCFLKGGDPVRAAKAFHGLNMTDKAKAILSRETSLESRVLLGKIALDQGDYQQTTELLKGTDHHETLSQAYENLGRYKDAAFHLEKAGELKRAADLYAKANDHQRAAILFEQQACFEEAAQSYEKLKKYEQAAKFFNLAKNRLKTGACLFKIGRLEEALEQLQSMPQDGPQSEEAKTIMAEIFYKTGRFSIAREMFEELLTDTVMDDDTLHLYYSLARCFEEEGQLESARKYFERIITRRIGYKDVNKRLQNLHQKLGKPMVKPAGGDLSAPSGLGPGEMIDDRFRILNKIGKGGMGYIFKCRDTSLDRDIALKMLLHARGNFEELKAELIMARDLTHPYIIKVFDIGQWKGMGYFTMEFVDGVPLKAYIQQSNNSIEHETKLLIKICQALKCAHDQKVVHRDIKPQNILVTNKGEPKVLDFGIAKRLKPGQNDRTISGSPKYMSPEQVRNRDIDWRTDIYALGVLMFYMFTKKEPFVARTPQQIMLMQLNQQLPDPLEYNSHLPAWLVDIIRKCCNKDKNARFSNMQELAFELQMNLMDDI